MWPVPYLVAWMLTEFLVALLLITLPPISEHLLNQCHTDPALYPCYQPLVKGINTMDNSLEKILKNLSCHPLLERSLWNSKHYIQLDTSDFSGIDPFNMAAMIDKTEQLLQQHHTTIGIGRYNEKRELYQHPQYNNRCIHLGIDICTTAHTPLFAPINGIIHQIANHDMPGTMGPPSLLHHVQQHTFYTSMAI